jgi:acetyl-CoA C-acetyltransferase
VAAYDWAQARSNAALDLADREVTVDQIANSAVVASPLRELTVSRPVDGAVAVLLAIESVGKRIVSDPVIVAGIGAAMDEHMLAHRAAGRFEACEAAARQAYGSAGLSDPSRASFAEISASSAAGELMVIEALGLGEGSPEDLFAEDAEVRVNLSGGALPADPVMATGLFRLSEAAERLTGRADGASAHFDTALVHASGGLGMQDHCVFVLRR